MVELVHNQHQVHAVQAGVVAPGLAQAVRAVVALQPRLLAERGDDLPDLPPVNGVACSRGCAC